MKKQFVVIGCGRFGRSISTKLYEHGCEVMVVDKDYDLIQEISDLVTYAVQADATEENTIKTLGIRNFDVAVVAIGDDIQASILISLMIKEMGVKHVVAKAINDMHGKVLYKIGVDRVVFPEREMGIRVANSLAVEHIIDSIQLADEYSVVETAAKEEWYGKTIEEINFRKKYGINILAVKHFNEVIVDITSDLAIREGDIIVMIGTNDKVNKLAED